MKPKHDIIKKLFSREKVGNKFNKKTYKPWIMQYHWKSYDDWDKYEWMKRSGYQTGWKDHYDKYMDPEHALQMLNKETRSYVRDKWKGRNLRLLNKETQEVIELEITEGKINIKN